MSGLLHENPYLEAFELRTISAQTYLNVNNFLENFEDITIGQSLRRLVLRDAMKYSDRSKFLTKGTGSLEVLDINRTIVNQLSFSLSDKL